MIRSLLSGLGSSPIAVFMNISSSTSILKIAVSSDVLSPKLATLLALQRAEEPDTQVSLTEVPAVDLFQGLNNGPYDAGITRRTSTTLPLSTLPLWREELAVAMPLRSPLLAHGAITSEALRDYQLIYGCTPSKETMSRLTDVLGCDQDRASSTVTSFELMAVLVAAGYCIGIAPRSRILQARSSGIVMRPLAGNSVWVETDIFQSAGKGKTTPAIERFIRRAQTIGESDCHETLSRVTHHIPHEQQPADSPTSATR